jgi:colicin import membrane protein
MADVDPEEARLIAAMEKKANAEFEKKRKEALERAQRSGKGQNFHLSEEGGANAATKRQIAQARHHDLPSEHHADPVPPAATRSAPPPSSDDAIKPGLELNKYMEASAQRDREFRERQEAAEREKQAALAGFGSSLSKYEEQARQRDLQAKQHREEEERRRQEDLAAQNAKQNAYKQKQANEEAEFRRRHEEAEKSKQVRWREGEGEGGGAHRDNDVV